MTDEDRIAEAMRLADQYAQEREHALRYRPVDNARAALEAYLRAALAPEALRAAEAALADIGDADREPGDDVAWCERRAAEALPAVRAALSHRP